MKYYILEPEVAGCLGDKTVMNREIHPPYVTALHYQFNGWLGDVLVESFPCFIATIDVVQQLQKIAASGVQFGDVCVTKGTQFQEIYPDQAIPEFKWLQINGIAGSEDFGLASDFRLVVSDRILNILKPLGISHALVEEFEVIL